MCVVFPNVSNKINHIMYRNFKWGMYLGGKLFWGNVELNNNVLEPKIN